MQQSSTVKKLLSASGLLAALFAVTTPFWLFTSEQSVTVLHKPQPTDGTTGTITLSSDNNTPVDEQASTKDSTDQHGKGSDAQMASNTTNPQQDKNTASPKPDKATDPQQDKAIDSKSHRASTSQQDSKTTDSKTKDDKSSTAASTASNSHTDSKDKDDKGDTSTAAKDVANASDKAAAKASDSDVKNNKDSLSSSTTKQAVSDKASKADDKTNGSKNDVASKGADKNLAANKDDLSKVSTDTSKDKSASDKSSDIGKEAKAIAEAAKSATGEDKFTTAAVETSNLEESAVESAAPIKQANLSLAEKVRNLTEQRTDADKAAYARSIEEREQQVDDAIASISGNYKVYLPSLLSEKAVVIYFSAPVTAKSTKINLRKDADLSKLKIDTLTGATLVKYQDQDTFMDVQTPAMDYVAQTLSSESGAQLFKIATVTTYPDNAAKLYSMSFTELNERKYPELTDDVPLDIDDFSVVYLCYPNWWGNMPGAIYSFLAKYDLSDKIVIPVCLYDKDKFSNTTDTIATIEPNSTVYPKGMLISRDDCSNEANLRNKIRTFLTSLCADFE